MISEQEFSFEKNKNDILQKLSETGVYEENQKIIKYFGNKNQIPLEEEENKIEEDPEKEEDNISLINPDDPRNYLLFVNYENVYIGAVYINDLLRRENFGLNIYSDDCFYFGRWKDNMKEGIGFLKINENLMYAGNFTTNQFNGFGILYDKAKNNLYLGQFNNGEYSEGIFYNIENEYFYRGKLKDGKKNDNLCSFFDAKNGHLFCGEIIEDEFNKGCIFFVEIEDVQNEEVAEVKFNIKKIFFFDNNNQNNKVINDDNFTNNFYKQLQELGNHIFQHDFNLKDQNQNYITYFSKLNAIKNCNKYFNVDEYNSFNNENNIECDFINYFYDVFNYFQNGQDKMNLKEYEKILENPEVIE